MEDLKEYNIYILDKYLITYPNSINVEYFSCSQYYGIMFKTSNGKYQLLHNRDMGNRLIINLNDGFWNDLPFKLETFDFLPKGITAQQIG